MCGICGILDYNQNSSAVKEDTLKKMCSAMYHRGPDDAGTYVNSLSTLGRASELKSHVGLGHRRLKIIDLSEAGHQPMSNEDKTIWIVFNGEVYNYLELRNELQNKGHIFKSHTDTETVIHLYEEYGKECVWFLRGMFAFAIWDEKEQLLLLARDRVGKKPLLYSYHNGVFCFASEFLALLTSGLIKKDINYDAIHYYLTCGYVPAPLTIYNNVFKLLPAHRLILKDQKITIEKYWQLDYLPKIKISEEDACAEILRLLKEAVKIRLYSDVPLGAFLSGGIDSSTVVALMSQLSEKKVQTFSIGFEEKDYSELKYARNIAERFQTEHREFIVKPDALKILPLLVERYGEPYADSSCIPTYYVSEQTKKYVTVALNGDGGDESFAGYERYQAMILAERLQKTPYVTRIVFQQLSKLLPDNIDPKNRLRRMKRFFEAASLPFNKRYIRWVAFLNDDLKRELYSREFSRPISYFNSAGVLDTYLNQYRDLLILDRLLDTDVHTYLPDDLLVKVDITSMANSLEARSPFLDNKLMEFVAKLPTEYKLRSSVKKYILKKAVSNLIPIENIHRRKMGFGVPIRQWFCNEMKGFLAGTLLSSSSLKRGYFRPEVIRSMVKKHIEGRRDYTFQLWALLMLELWHKRFID